MAEALETLLRRDRAVTAAGLAAVAVLAWAYTLWLALGMLPGRAMPPLMAMPALHGWTAADLALTALMWMAMMIAMMTPSAAPMILLHARVQRRSGRDPAPTTAAFLGGYLLAWAGFSILATLLQWGLHEAALLSGAMGRLAPFAGAAALLGAGLYQFTPLKARCLGECQSPIGFLARHWRDGIRGSLRMGLDHGLYCVGCCWVLMGLLFAAGIMNLIWIAGITLLVLAEKLVPAGGRVGRLAGLALIAWGLWVGARAVAGGD